ncbi:helix-turn-helix domain-containing protein [Aminobacter sp. AP02]|uniref:helix-turn-helix domain-containing protein n=1 Tax=Aminobacter sp. AP02 TaxID=2135737 RepID=UPI000D6D5D8D|nr:helix-turn-helix domain-containing protein [Aminobacter sp. AP02]PWK66936.1 helix-turn-helix protein [Aminobacter sp. AP02]
MAASLLDKWQAMEAVTASELPPAAKLVFFRLLAHMNTKTGRCDPSYQTLAGGTSITRRGVIDMVKVLENDGLLTVERSSGGAPGSGYSVNRYLIHLPRRSEENGTGEVNSVHHGSVENFTRGSEEYGTPPSEENSVGGVKKSALKYGNRTREGEYRKLNTGNEHSPRERGFGRGSIEEGPDIDGSFPVFWKHYPRRVNEPKARAAYVLAIRSGADPDVILQGCMRYAADRSGQEARFTAHAATWLANRRWEDEAPRAGAAPIIDESGKVIEFSAARQPQRETELERIARICGLRGVAS